MSSDDDQKQLKKPLREKDQQKQKAQSDDDDDDHDGGRDSNSDFGISVEKIEHMFNQRDMESLKEIGGTQKMAAALNSTIEGIREENDIEQRIQVFGDNIPEEEEPISIQDMILECFEDPVLRILLAATFVSLIVGISTDGLAQGWFQSAAIFIAVGIIVVVTVVNNYMKQMKFRELHAKSDERDVSVNRNGKTMQVSIHDLVVGDVMFFETGEHFCIDGILVQGYSIKCDESPMTGETDLIKKQVYEKCLEADEDDHHSQPTPFLVSGTQVMEGSGEVLVCAVGQNTVYNKIKALVQQKNDDTPLQIKLAELADDIGKVGMFCAAATVLAASIHLIYDRMSAHQEGDPSIWDMKLVKELLDFLVLGITIVVVAVPEGLPLAVTIALAYSSKKMFEEQNLVRYMSACETMGGADNICSDKTGTLTQNEMTATNIYALGKSVTKFDQKMFDKKSADIICEGICLNSSALPKIDKGGEVEQTGNKTECALLQFAYDLGYDYRQYRGVTASKVEKDRLIRVCPFSSKIKMMSCAYEYQSGQARVYVKGAPDYLLDSCDKIYEESGEKELTSETKKKIEETIISYADKSLRTLMLAYKDVSKKEALESTDEGLTKNLVFVGIVGIKDPLRPEINDAIKQCKKAGITVRMVTGDRRETAVAIGKDAGILEKDFKPNEQNKYTVMDGDDFEKFVGGKKKNDKGDEVVGNLDNMKLVDKNLKILARSRPEHKYLMVLGLKQLKHVVAVTGDGTNDAPALKKADIGFAMGIAGTKVAQEASGIVILDDNFASIITSIKWGRNVFECIRQFLQFQLSVNFVAMFMAFLGGVILRESPLNAIEMLWVNLIMDTFASLALATEAPSEELLTRKPYSKYEYIITPGMFRSVIMMGFFQCAYLTFFLFYGEHIFNVPSGRRNDEWTYQNGKHYTLFFNVFVYLQVFNEINARQLKREELNVFEGFFDNPIFSLMLAITVIVQTVLIQYGGFAVQLTPLTVNEHLTCVLIGLLSLIIGYIIKLIPEGFYQSFEIFSVQKVFDRAEEEAKERERELERLKEERKQLKKIKNFNKGQKGSDDEDEDDDDDGEGKKKNRKNNNDDDDDQDDQKSHRSSFYEKPATYRAEAQKIAQEQHSEKAAQKQKKQESSGEEEVEMVEKNSDQKEQKGKDKEKSRENNDNDLEKSKSKQKEQSKKEEKSPQQK